MDGYWFDVTPDTYLLATADSSICMIAFVENTDNDWIVGSAFLKGFYAIFDDSLGELTFAPRLGAAVTAIETADTPRRTFNILFNPKFYIIASVVGGTILIISIFAWVLSKYVINSGRKVEGSKDQKVDDFFKGLLKQQNGEANANILQSALQNKQTVIILQ